MHLGAFNCHMVTDSSFREMVVVHPDNEFLEDITGKLKEVCLSYQNLSAMSLLIVSNSGIIQLSSSHQPDAFIVIQFSCYLVFSMGSFYICFFRVECLHLLCTM